MIITISILFILYGCAKTYHNGNKFEMYILRHTMIDKDNDEFIKDDSPIFTGNNIKSYDWDIHINILTEEFLEDKNNDPEEDSDSFINVGPQILGVLCLMLEMKA